MLNIVVVVVVVVVVAVVALSFSNSCFATGTTDALAQSWIGEFACKRKARICSVPIPRSIRLQRKEQGMDKKIKRFVLLLYLYCCCCC